MGEHLGGGSREALELPRVFRKDLSYLNFLICAVGLLRAASISGCLKDCMRIHGSRLTTWRTDLWLPSGRGREWDRLGVWDEWMQTIPFRVDSNVLLLHSTGNSIQSLVIDHDRRSRGKKNVHVCMTGSLCGTIEKDTIFKSTIL